MFTYFVMPGYAVSSWQRRATNDEVLQRSVEVLEEFVLFCVSAGNAKEREKYFVVGAAAIRRRHEPPSTTTLIHTYLPGTLFCLTTRITHSDRFV
jgi:hypothetical protein